MQLKLGIIMDPISGIKTYKDSSFAMLLEAQRRDYQLYYLEMNDLSLIDGIAHAHVRPLRVTDNTSDWFELGESSFIPLHQLDALLMRKDPPFDMEYIYATYILEQAEREGLLVVNKPQSLRDANEKMFTAWFPQCIAPTLVSRQKDQLKGFISEHQDAIIKPLEGMGGSGIFRVKADDPNTNVILETLSEHESKYIMAQKFLPEISAGDKRILIVDGEPVDYALARIPQQGETRGNLAAGGRAEGLALSERDRWLCQQVGPELKARGLLCVGMDVIGDYVTEINVTSPTCIRELDKLYELNISALLMDAIEKRIN